MAKLMTNREMELFRCLIHTRKALMVAMPNCEAEPTIEFVANATASELSFDLDEDDIAECCETVRASSEKV